jgi:hypothetical protein
VNSFFNWSRNIAGALRFLHELSFSTWLADRCFANPMVWSLIVLELVVTALAMLSDFHVLVHLSEGIPVFQLIFSTLLVYAASRYLEELDREANASNP